MFVRVTVNLILSSNRMNICSNFLSGIHLFVRFHPVIRFVCFYLNSLVFKVGDGHPHHSHEASSIFLFSIHGLLLISSEVGLLLIFEKW